ncbi:hypothetical protein [Lactiplantibacillus fabifermentans]|uniref:Uncharacterized protein n=2 Tax=Lactiplantibacillus fabifermentans TaxID=483011 RepID=A0A0R2NLL0_9LACO|nr:hypothetical protein [Lactiplantibacillus fabifermentans]ETY73921.1 hypothetical protein LFAB_09815 [Lactiplantibacillus fabifermentans T30PCM01]KRO26639.1 hypothetical protein DY78_GL000749 [Lactiplantibacillus fabifermentans DSM 21115]
MADEDRMTRQQYRQQQTQPEPEAEPMDDQPVDDTEDASGSASRRAYAAENNRAIEEVKTKRLARKLNWVILGLVLAIVVVFLILFFTP